MVDEQDGTPLTPEQDAAVRRLVADARHDEPMPATVAARLDKVLVHLSTESATPAAKPVVVDLDTRRRRRHAGRLLLAAAAVVIGAVALGQVLGTGGVGQGDSQDAGSAADPAAEPERNSAAQPSDSDAGDGAAESAPEGPAEIPDPTAADSLDADSYLRLRDYVPVDLSSQGFETQVRKVYRDTRLSKRAALANKSLVGDVQAFDCPAADYGDGLLLPAYYDGEPAVLAFRPPVGSQRVAQLLACGSADELGSLALAYGPRD